MIPLLLKNIDGTVRRLAAYAFWRNRGQIHAGSGCVEKNC